MQSTKRRLALLLGAAIAAMAFAAPGASAATEVFDASSGEPCPEVEPAIEKTATPLTLLKSSLSYEGGGCTVHVRNGGGFVKEVAFAADVECSSEFDVHVGPDGWGYVDNVVYTTCGPWTGSISPCTGDRVVAPAEYNPSNLFKYKNAATDLNISMCSQMSTSKYWGFSSFDITVPASNPGLQVWTNQQTAASHDPYYHHTGKWVIEKLLTITH